jgi:hypothetical protein
MTPARRGDWSLALLPGALLLLGCLLWVFRLGRWMDDYDLAEIDPATGAIIRLTWLADFPFWRPLHLTFTVALETLAHGHIWAAHIVVHLVHGLCGWLTYRVARAAGLPVRAACLACVLMLVYPLHAQAVHWVAALGTVAGTACALGVFWAALAILQRGYSARRLTWLTLCAVMTPCWNEQPAGAFLALPLLAAAFGARSGVVWRRVAGPTAIAWAAAAGYAALYLAQAPEGARGAADGFAGPVGVFEGALRAAAGVWAVHQWDAELAGAFEMLRRLASTGGTQLAVGLAVVVVAGGRWMRGFADAAAGVVPAQRGVGLAIGCVAAACATWLPILVTTGWTFELRYLYPVAPFMAVGLASVVSLATGVLPRALAMAWVGGGCVLVIGVSGASLQAGYAEAFAQRSSMDERSALALRSAAPEPGARAFFVPMRVETELLDTGASRFDASLASVWAVRWAAPNVVREVYGRRDVGAGHTWTPAAGSPVRRAGAAGLVVTGAHRTTLVPIVGEDAHRVPWDRAVPFSVHADASVTVWPGVEVVSANGSRARHACPAHGPGARVAGRYFAVPSGDWWRSAVRFERPPGTPAHSDTVFDDGVPLRSVWLHPVYAGMTDHAVAAFDVSGGDAIVLRAALVDAARSTDGVRIRVFADGEPVGGSLRLDPAVIGSGWAVREVRVPAGAERVRVVVDAGPAGDHWFDAVWVHALVGSFTPAR